MGYTIDNERKTTYEFNDHGRLAEMKIENDQTFRFGYLENTKFLSTVVYPNNITKKINYDPNRRLISSIIYESDSINISQFDYINDLLGRCVGMEKKFDGQMKSFNYDYNSRSEVTQANQLNNPIYSFLYNYDNIGNRISTIENSVQKQYKTNALNQYSDSNIAYDADGNQTRIKTSTGVWEVKYNAENRPIKFTQADTVITMNYDYKGRRFIKTVNGMTQKFVYDNYVQIEELNANNQTVKSYVWDPTGGRLTQLFATKIKDDTYFYIHDANKNITEMIDTNLNIVAHYEYSPFGAVTASSGALATSNLFRFSNEYSDVDIGLIYYNYRHYNPLYGRWLSRDPIGERGGDNLYGMVRNNLIRYFDVLGLIIDTLESWGEATVEIVGKVYEYGKTATVSATFLLEKNASVYVPYTGFYTDMAGKIAAATIHLATADPKAAYEPASQALDGLVSDMEGLILANTAGKLCACETLYETKDITTSERVLGAIKVAVIPNYKIYLGAWFGLNNMSEKLTEDQLAQLSPNDFASHNHDVKSLEDAGGWKELQWVYEVNTHAVESGETDGPCGQVIRVVGTVGFTLFAAPFEEIMYRITHVGKKGGMVE